MGLLACITFANVLVRYFTDQSFAWTEEFSVFLMIVLALVAGSAVGGAQPADPHRILRRQRPGVARSSALARFGAIMVFLLFALIARAEHAHGLRRLSRSARPRRASACRSGGTRSGCRSCRWRSPAARWACSSRGAGDARMIPTLLFVAFVVMLLLGVPIGAALGLAGAACIALANSDAQWFGLLAVPQNFYAGLGKYPLLAIPMFVLVGSIFDRSGVALRLVNFAIAIVGRGPGMLPLVAIAVAMFLGGISGSGPANAAAVGAVMIAAMSRAGYPPAFSASVVGAAAATDILIPPSVAFIVYSVLVPGASVPALFAAGMIPGILAGLALMIPAVWLARKHKMGALEVDPAAAAVLEEPARGHLGPVRAGADPGRHARRLVHADRGGGGGGVLRPVRRHGRAPDHQGARPVRHPARIGRALGGDPAGGVAGRHLRLLAVDAGRDRSGHRAPSSIRASANTACCRC